MNSPLIVMPAPTSRTLSAPSALLPLWAGDRSVVAIHKQSAGTKETNAGTLCEKAAIAVEPCQHFERVRKASQGLTLGAVDPTPGLRQLQSCFPASKLKPAIGRIHDSAN